MAAVRTTQKTQFYCKNSYVTLQLVRENTVPTVTWCRPHRKHIFPFIAACWEVFTEPLPGNALIKFVTIY
jgi:hypothetical protein